MRRGASLGDTSSDRAVSHGSRAPAGGLAWVCHNFMASPVLSDRRFTKISVGGDAVRRRSVMMNTGPFGGAKFRPARVHHCRALRTYKLVDLLRQRRERHYIFTDARFFTTLPVEGSRSCRCRRAGVEIWLMSKTWRRHAHSLGFSAALTFA